VGRGDAVMVETEPRVALNGKYGIGKAASILGIHRNTLRSYTKDGKIKCGLHRNNDRIFYFGHEILKFWRTF